MNKQIQEVTTEAEKRKLVLFSPCFFRFLSPVNEPINIHHFELPYDSRLNNRKGRTESCVYIRERRCPGIVEAITSSGYKLTNLTTRLNFAMRRIFREKRVKSGRYYLSFSLARPFYFVTEIVRHPSSLPPLSLVSNEREKRTVLFYQSDETAWEFVYLFPIKERRALRRRKTRGWALRYPGLPCHQRFISVAPAPP